MKKDQITNNEIIPMCVVSFIILLIFILIWLQQIEIATLRNNISRTYDTLSDTWNISTERLAELEDYENGNELEARVTMRFGSIPVPESANDLVQHMLDTDRKLYLLSSAMGYSYSPKQNVTESDRYVKT